MPKDCNHINPLQRGGSHQKGRQREALFPENTPVDERQLTDYLTFAKRYAKHIKYYKSDNVAFGDWTTFWNKDLSALISGLVDFPIEIVRDFQNNLRTYLAKGDMAVDEVSLLRHTSLLFRVPLILIKELLDTLYRLPQQHPLREQLSLLLEREAKTAIERIIAYHKGARDNIDNFTDVPLTRKDFEPEVDNITLPVIIAEKLEAVAVFTNSSLQLPYIEFDWATYYQEHPLDIRPFQEEEGNAYRQVFDALNYQLFTAAFDRIIEITLKARREAEAHLQASLETYQEHSPHYGLWLTFQRLLEFNRSQLNDYTRRHLEFYYQKVLGLPPLEPKEDQVHLLFELQKNQANHLLKAGTLFKAGKDDAGKEVYYALNYDYVINRAKVVGLQSWFENAAGQIIAAIKVDTADGVEAELEGDFPHWPAFFPGVEQDNSQVGPQARLGFALADRQLLLQEGERHIKLNFDQSVAHTFNTDWAVYYTSEKGWTRITDISIQASEPTSVNLLLNGGSAPCLPFDAAIHIDEGTHLDDFETAMPLLKFELINNHNSWRSFKFNSVQLSVTVQNVRDLSIHNKDGQADTSKPFPLFGNQPGALPFVIIGNNEIFSKALNKLELVPEWEEQYSKTGFFYKNDEDYCLRLQFLKEGRWQGEQGYTKDKYHLFEKDTRNHKIDFSTELNAMGILSSPATENPIFDAKAKNGFIRIEVDRDFGHQEYFKQQALAMIEKTKTNGSYNPNTINTSSNLPKKPYPAILNTLSIDYNTKPQQPAKVYHLHPFGFKSTNSFDTLVPIIQNKGELYIGIDQLDPPQRLSLLVQVADGTAAPLSEPAQMEWHYLQDDQWLQTGLKIDDKTNQFARSGIINFDIPSNANIQHRVLPGGLHWLRCSVAEHTDALNDIKSIQAQAATATFVDNDNDPDFLATPLEPETISKLQVSEAAVKTISQPYASFGGRGKEDSQPYYIRVSERLRHKNRAIQIWDYEHLILQHFPDIYKAKCLNHTELDNAGKPGHVTIVCLPKVHPNSKNPLRPYVEKKRLLDICGLIKARSSPFVQLKVVQPKLEGVQLSFDVAFTPDIADIPFYRQELNQALIEYLSPWAFNHGEEISFGGHWHKSSIIHFLDKQPYVDYVKDVKMFHKLQIDQLENSWRKVDVEVVIASTDRSILVSHDAHIINNLNRNDSGLSADSQDCISEQAQPRPC